MLIFQKLKKGAYYLSARILGRKKSYKLRYFHNRGHFPDLDNPKDLSEILISRIINKEFTQYAKYADKVQVREYISQKGLKHILLKHYGYWLDPYDISLGVLPEKFVLKVSNGSGGKNIFVCKDKREFDLISVQRELRKALKIKHGYEPQYNVYQPVIICEELLDTGTDAWPVDYKFTCIHGRPIDVFVGTERERGVKFCTMDLEWNVLHNTKKEFLPNTYPPKPKHLSEMIEIAKKLSADFDFVRVDLYEHNDKIYFGELTFSPWGGLLYSYTDEAILEYGKLLSAQ